MGKPLLDALTRRLPSEPCAEVTEPLADLEEEEVEMLLQDLLQGEPTRWDLRVDKSATIAESEQQ